jgi:hypothetical protein
METPLFIAASLCVLLFVVKGVRYIQRIRAKRELEKAERALTQWIRDHPHRQLNTSDDGWKRFEKLMCTFLRFTHVYQLTDEELGRHMHRLKRRYINFT